MLRSLRSDTHCSCEQGQKYKLVHLAESASLKLCTVEGVEVEFFNE